MKILAADTSTSSGSVALLDGERMVAEWTFQSAQTHNRRLLAGIQGFLQKTGWSLGEVDGFAVTIGPGSFTGLRIGLTTVKTLAWALQKPYIGVPTLDALAAPLRLACRPICALLDAQKKELYCGFYHPDGKGTLRRAGNPEILSPASLLGRINDPTIFCGNGWLICRDLLKKELGDLVVEAPPPFHILRAGFVAEIARSSLLRGEVDDPVASTPLYVRPSEAELNLPRSLRP